MTKDHFKIAAATVALKKMFASEGCVNICTIREVMQLLGAVENEDYRALSALHCVHFRDMPDNMRQEAINRTIRMVFADTVDLDKIEEAALQRLERKELPMATVEVMKEVPKEQPKQEITPAKPVTFWDRVAAFAHPHGKAS